MCLLHKVSNYITILGEIWLHVFDFIRNWYRKKSWSSYWWNHIIYIISPAIEFIFQLLCMHIFFTNKLLIVSEHRLQTCTQIYVYIVGFRRYYRLHKGIMCLYLECTKTHKETPCQNDNKIHSKTQTKYKEILLSNDLIKPFLLDFQFIVIILTY